MEVMVDVGCDRRRGRSQWLVDGAERTAMGRWREWRLARLGGER